LTLCALTVFAWQDAFTRLDLPRQNFEQGMKEYLKGQLGEKELAIPGIGAKSKIAFRAMDEATKVAVLKELAGAAESIAMSPAFQTAYEAMIKSQHNAVNHGLTVTDTDAEMAKMTASIQNGDDRAAQTALENTMRDQLKMLYTNMLENINSMDAGVLTELASSVKDQAESIPPRNAAEKAQQAKGLAMLKEVPVVAKTDVAGAREKLKTGILMTIYASSGNAAAAAADQTRVEQQKNYNRYAFRPAMKRTLTAWVALAKTVDFQAATVAKGNVKVFVNTAYEQKSGAWKFLYRLGAGPTSALSQFASAWAAEL
jgi:hypothetical protein